MAFATRKSARYDRPICPRAFKTQSFETAKTRVLTGIYDDRYTALRQLRWCD